MNKNNIRSPNNIFWLLFFGLIFLIPKNVYAVSIYGNECTRVNSAMSNFSDKTNYILKTYYSYNNDDLVEISSFVFYTNSPVLYKNGSFSVPNSSFSACFSVYSFSKGCLDREGAFTQSSVLSSGSIESGLVNGYDNPKSYCTLDKVSIVNYCEGSDVWNSMPDYDVNNLNEYPLDSIHVTSPISSIKTNNKYYTFVFKGKIKLGENDIEDNITSQIISKFIRNKFRYDFKSDKENLTGLSCLGAFKIDKEDSFTDEVMLRNLIDGKITFHNEKYDVIDYVDDFSCGVGGDFKSWNSKGYYNFVVNTSVYVGDSPGANEYKFYFTVPHEFNGIFSYKTITVNYSLERGIYSDDNFDGIDDTSLEVIPDSEIEIIHPGFVFPSTLTPSGSNNFNDGDIVQNNNNNIVFNNGSDVSEAERNGILNMLDNGLRTTTGRLKSLGTSLVGFRDNMTGLFSFLPDDIVSLFYLGISLAAVFFILGLRR